MPAERVSIFNHVLGPVMRGPSSSHTAAALRIAQYVLPFTHSSLESVTVQYDPSGSLATTAGPQGSNMGLAAGFLGFSCADDRMPDSLRLIEDAGIRFETVVAAIPEVDHPNTYKLRVCMKDSIEKDVEVVAVSTGGGAFQICRINGFVMEDDGGSNCAVFEVPLTKEPLFRREYNDKASRNQWNELVQLANDSASSQTDTVAFRFTSSVDIEPQLVEGLKAIAQGCFWAVIPCVLPAPMNTSATALFHSVQQMKDWMKAKGNGDMPLWEVAVEHESALTGLDSRTVLSKACELVAIYAQSVDAGLKGTQYKDRILGPQSVGFQERLASNASMLDLGNLNIVIAYVSSYMEVKSSFGVIIAGPTAGSCACLPGCILGFGRSMNKSTPDLAKALLISGLVGALIANKSTFAAEEGGCQAECGAAGAMASAGLVYLLGGSPRQSIVAASLTLQSLLGMVCDPIGNRVEAPCLTRNIAAASMAASSANLAVAGYSSVIPFDEVLAAHWEICQTMPRSLRCTGLGGLAAQPSARRIEEQLNTCGQCDGCLTGNESVW